MLTTVCQWFLYFTIYSVLGWVCETIYCSIGQKKFVNRGFLNGPVCPVYGFGGILVVFFLRSVSHNVLALFLSGMVVTTVLEYITSVLLEKLFHMRWWDYSRYRFQINGRVCLLNSLMFGGLSVVMMLGIHPEAEKLVAKIPETVLPWVSLGLLLVFVSDTFATVYSLLKAKGKLEEVHQLFGEIREKREEARAHLREELQEKADNFEARLEKYRLPEGVSLHEYIEARRKRINEIHLDKAWTPRRLMKAFPHLDSPKYAETLARLREKWNEKR